MDGDGDIFLVMSSTWSDGHIVHKTIMMSVISDGYGIVPGQLFPYFEVDDRWEDRANSTGFRMQRIL